MYYYFLLLSFFYFLYQFIIISNFADVIIFYNNFTYKYLHSKIKNAFNKKIYFDDNIKVDKSSQFNNMNDINQYLQSCCE
jgi:hypothetical protein